MRRDVLLLVGVIGFVLLLQVTIRPSGNGVIVREVSPPATGPAARVGAETQAPSNPEGAAGPQTGDDMLSGYDQAIKAAEVATAGGNFQEARERLAALESNVEEYWQGREPPTPETRMAAARISVRCGELHLRLHEYMKAHVSFSRAIRDLGEPDEGSAETLVYRGAVEKKRKAISKAVARETANDPAAKRELRAIALREHERPAELGTAGTHGKNGAAAHDAKKAPAAPMDKEARFQLAVLAAKQLKAAMRNPDSFKLVQVLTMDDGTSCYAYRAQNGFGGMNLGHALITPSGRMSTDGMSGFEGMWNKWCAHKSGEDTTWTVGYAAGFRGIFGGD